LEWRGDLLAELAILRVPELVALKRPKGSQEILPFKFLVTSRDGLCFFVEPRGFSSSQLRVKPAELTSLDTWEWEADAKLVREACASPNPVVLFLFDADLDPGRYLRIDTLPEPARGAKTVLLSFPIENAITAESVRALADEIAKQREVPAAG